MSKKTHPETEHLLALIGERYGDRLTPKELDEVCVSLTSILDGAAAMRAIKLENGDEPNQTFKPEGDPE
jgi:hypothetical protein